MKKIIAVILAAGCLVTGVFAVTSVDVDVNGAMPITYIKTDTSHTVFSNTTRTVTETVETSYGFDVSSTIWLTKKVGLKAGVTVGTPSVTEVNVDTYLNDKRQEGLSGKTSSKYEDDTSHSYAKYVIFAGLALNLTSTSVGKVTVVPGVCLDYDIVTLKSDGSKTEYLRIGAGADFIVTANLTKTVYLNLSVPVAYEVIQKKDGVDLDMDNGRWIIDPKLGLGYRF